MALKSIYNATDNSTFAYWMKNPVEMTNMFLKDMETENKHSTCFALTTKAENDHDLAEEFIQLQCNATAFATQVLCMLGKNFEALENLILL